MNKRKFVSKNSIILFYLILYYNLSFIKASNIGPTLNYMFMCIYISKLYFIYRNKSILYSIYVSISVFPYILFYFI